MSVIMMLRAQGDPESLEKWAKSHADQVTAISAAGQQAGAIHHLFAAGDREVVVIDEWPDEASFKRFFDSQPDIPTVMQAAGVTGQPEITFLRKLDTPDEF